MKILLSFFLAILLLACGTSSNKPKDNHILPRVVDDVKWFFHEGDTLLWVYWRYSTQHTRLSSSSRHSTETYEHERNVFTVFKFKNNNLEFMYDKEPDCVNHEECGTRYVDKTIAYSSDLLAFECYCEGGFTIVDIATGKEWASKKNLAEKFPELKSGIGKHYTFPALADVIQFEASDGQVINLSLEEKKTIPYRKEMDWGSEVNKPTQWIETPKQRIYFAKNDNDNRCYLAVRSIKSGTSQDRKYRTGEQHWLNPVILTQHNSTKGYFDESENSFFVLHAEKYSDAMETDKLSKVNTKGENVYTIDLKAIGRLQTYLVAEKYIYLGNSEGLHIYDKATGKEIKTIVYGEMEFPKEQAK